MKNGYPNYEYDGVIIKYNKDKEIENVEQIGSAEGYEQISYVLGTSDGGYIAICKFNSPSITIGDNIITREGEYDNNILIKYNEKGKVQWITQLGAIEVQTISETSDNGFIIGGKFKEVNVKVGEITLQNAATRGYDVAIVKCDQQGKVQWANSIGGEDDDRVDNVIETKNKEYIADCYFASRLTILGEEHNINGNSKMWIKYNSEGNVVESGQDIHDVVDVTDGKGYIVSDIGVDGVKLVKYSSDNEVEWTNTSKVEIASGGSLDEVKITPDGGAIMGGLFCYPDDKENYKYKCIIKYDKNGNIEWDVDWCGNYHVSFIIETYDNSYILMFQTDVLSGWDYIKLNEIGKIYGEPEIPETKKIIVDNKLKEFRITTKVEEINGEKGGTISGDGSTLENPYETVQYGKRSTQPITMEPNAGYSISKITINGEEIEFNREENGTYTLPQFENVTDNKHIVVTYVLNSQKEPEVIVHHYKKGTKDRVAIDERYTGELGEPYRTEPHMDLEDYELAKDEATGEFITPTNASGIYKEGVQEVTYEYEARKIPLTVHHYIEGTSSPVPMSDGSLAKDIISEGIEGTQYTTDPVEPDWTYELVGTPENSTGKFEKPEVVVTYYYRRIESPGVIVRHIDIDTEEEIADSVIIPEEGMARYGDKYTTDIANELLDRYEFVNRTDNWEGTMTEKQIEVIYKYRIKYNIQITKYKKGTSKIIKGVKFLVTGKDMGEGGKEYTTDSYGIANITGLEQGETYTVKEIYAKGYYIDETEITLKVEKEGNNLKLEYYGRGTKDSPIIVQDANETPVVQINLENVDISKYNVELTKVGEGTGKLLEGARFEITGPERELEERKYVTAQNGVIMIENLYVNEEYTLTETLAPKGYKLSETPVKFKATQENGIWSLDIIEGSFKETKIEGSTIKLKWEDETLFKVEKRDIETQELLKGAKYTIKDLDGDYAKDMLGKEEEINGERMKVLTTNEQGILTAEIQPGSYQIEEVQAPYGYDLPDKRIQNFEINELGAYANGLKSIWGEKLSAGEYSDARPVSIKDICATSDGGFIAVGYCNSSKIKIGNAIYTFDNDGNKMIIIKYNKDKVIEWINHIEGDNFEADKNNTFKKIVETNNEEYLLTILGGKNIIIPNYAEGNISNNIYTIVRYNNSGGVSSVSSVRGDDETASNIYLRTICSTPDGGYVLGGYSAVSDKKVILNEEYTLKNGGFLIKCSKNNEIESVYNTEENIFDVVATPDEGYVINKGLLQCVKLNKIFEEEKVFEAPSYPMIPISILQTNDGGIIVGSTLGQMYTIIKYNPEGNIEWEKTLYGGNVSGVNLLESIKVYQTSDNGYVALLPNSMRIYSGDLVAYGNSSIIKYDAKGNEVYVKSENFQISNIVETNEGNYIGGGFYSGDSSKNIILSNGDTLTNGTDIEAGFIIEYKEANVDKYEESDSSYNYDGSSIKDILSTDDGGYIAIRHADNDINIEENNIESGSGILIKYNSSDDIQWINVIKSTGEVNITNIAITSDKGYIIVCNINGEDISNNDTIIESDTIGPGFILLKYNENGELKWNSQIIEGGINAEITKITKTNDGGFIAIGCFESESITLGDKTINGVEGNTNSLIVKYKKAEDENNLKERYEVEWAHCINKDDNYTELMSVTQTQDGKYLVGGDFIGENIEIDSEVLINPNYNDPDISELSNRMGMLICYGENGELEWADTIGGKYYNLITSVVPTLDKGFIVGGIFADSTITLLNGNTYTIPGEDGNAGSDKNKRFLIIKYNENLQVEFVRAYLSNTESFVGPIITTTADNGFIVGGIYNSYYDNYSAEDVKVKFDANGNVEWLINSVLEGNINNSIAQLKDGTYLLVYEEQDYGYIKKLENKVIPRTQILTFLDKKNEYIIDSKLDKNGTDRITSKDEEISYNITYNAQVGKYKGNAVITIVDELPYALDIDKMREAYNKAKNNTSGEYEISTVSEVFTEEWLKEVLDGGTYEEKQDGEGNQLYTITWTKTVENIDTLETEQLQDLTINKNIKVIFKGIDLQEDSFKNTVKGRIELEATNQTIETEPTTHETKTDFTTNIKITKTWEHGNSKFEKPKSITLQVKNGEQVVESYTVTEQDNWTHTFTGLPKYNTETGEEIQYTVDEQAVEGESLEYYTKK